jgi:hypothetical protein
MAEFNLTDVTNQIEKKWIEYIKLELSRSWWAAHEKNKDTDNFLV